MNWIIDITVAVLYLLISIMNQKWEMFWKLNMTVRLQNHFLHKLLMFIAFVLLNSENNYEL